MGDPLKAGGKIKIVWMGDPNLKIEWLIRSKQVERIQIIWMGGKLKAGKVGIPSRGKIQVKVSLLWHDHILAGWEIKVVRMGDCSRWVGKTTLNVWLNHSSW